MDELKRETRDDAYYYVSKASGKPHNRKKFPNPEQIVLNSLQATVVEMQNVRINARVHSRKRMIFTVFNQRISFSLGTKAPVAKQPTNDKMDAVQTAQGLSTVHLKKPKSGTQPRLEIQDEVAPSNEVENSIMNISKDEDKKNSWEDLLASDKLFEEFEDFIERKHKEARDKGDTDYMSKKYIEKKIKKLWYK